MFGRLVRRLGHQRWFAATFRRLVPLDRRVYRWTNGKFSPLGAGWLIPTLMLTTTGRRSGLPRSQPLVYARDGDDFLVIGSNWGQAHQPAWSGNLLANPAASVMVDGREVAVTARLVPHGPERDGLFTKLENEWPAYRSYVGRAAHRDIRLFRLRPVQA
jgi:deazaflavin-dependent oxidoreductase (nitroreductase family)